MDASSEARIERFVARNQANFERILARGVHPHIAPLWLHINTVRWTSCRAKFQVVQQGLFCAACELFSCSLYGHIF